MEIFVSGIDSFVCGIIGPKGRRFVPFIGTLFIYILFMNLAGLIPFMKSPTTSWSTTAALALCVFVYVQYTALRELGLFRYLDHLAGKPRGALAFTIVIPLLVFLTHILSELVRPLTLSLRLLGNISGDDIVIAALGSSGLIWIPLLLFNMLLSVLTAVVQAVVFCVLSTIYFSLVMPEVD
jgi:F-type H+-transporting ATPase subunit a